MIQDTLLEQHIDLGTIIDIKNLNSVEKQVLFTLYFVEEKYNIQELTTAQIYDFINNKLRIKALFPAINMAIKRASTKISSVTENGRQYHKIMSVGIIEVKKLIKENIDKPIPTTLITQSVKMERSAFYSIVPEEIVATEKGYFKKVIMQINGCYKDGYYDACFVMIRRAVETQIIEVYEYLKQEDTIKDSASHYLTFEKLIDNTLQNKSIKLSKIAKKDLQDIKKFGDTAAHNRKINMIKSDIDKYSSSIRLIIEELINNKN